jgi:predicted MFS family arabinose efflux permease
MIGGVGIVITPFVIRIIPKMRGHIQPSVLSVLPLESLSIVIRNSAQRSALLFSGLLMLGHFLIIPFINPYIEFNKGFSKDMIPMIYLVGGIASLISAIFLGRVADKIGKLRVFLYSVFFSLFMVLIITHLPDIHYALIIGFFSLWFMLATGRAITSQAMISEVVKPEQRGSFMSINGSIQQLGQGIAALLAGAIVLTERSGKILRYNWVGYLSAIVLTASFFLAYYLFRKLDKKNNLKLSVLNENE